MIYYVSARTIRDLGLLFGRQLPSWSWLWWWKSFYLLHFSMLVQTPTLHIYPFTTAKSEPLKYNEKKQAKWNRSLNSFMKWDESEWRLRSTPCWLYTMYTYSTLDIPPPPLCMHFLLAHVSVCCWWDAVLSVVKNNHSQRLYVSKKFAEMLWNIKQKRTYKVERGESWFTRREHRNASSFWTQMS